jgi:hypothetical protein
VGPPRALRLETNVTGWILSADPDSYELSCDQLTASCTQPYLRSRPAAPSDGVARLVHEESAAPWSEKRVVVRAQLRAGKVEGWAGLWVRASDARGHLLAARTMQSNGLRGTTSFEWVELSLLVPAQASTVSFGVELHGRGALHLRAIELGPSTEGASAMR